MSDEIPIPILSLAHVQRVTRPVEGPLHSPHFTILDDAALDRLAKALTRDRPRPIPVFAYGSLIWNPGFEVAARRRARAVGWHRQFSIHLDHFRGSPEEPGLMLALASGGECDGLLLDIAPGTEMESLRALLRRELVAHELAANAVWIEVATDRGREQALTFYANPVGTELADLTVDQQARRLARANGAAGSGAEYLHRTAHGLRDAGIFDPYIWELDRLVAAEIDRLHD
ncbi:MAG: gamma-glutamylcyclotransferase [Paracoccus sp. (in: a-proteobacteria)]|uniref:gamma-glutamylcyclotransferase n=1 Tax=Paracoccus sp. TaxID=267 RepID=UPI0026DFC47E|nr:gamma-glutamylcyclotransferase [Paracoccus sp. (in: a-proteobacteria)]MDO5630966.1 gamma-glutamylcyclotransferase [Paracoccus sp. (in: a-proteobacteria)]